MKKVLFLQIKGKSYAGVWNVNKLVGEALLSKGYQVHIVSIRNNPGELKLDYDPKLVVKTINEKDLWEICHVSDIVSEIKKFHLFKAFKMSLLKVWHHIGLNMDVKKLHKYIFNYDPDYIVASHYQLLDMIPKNYLSKTIHEQHSSFLDAISNNANKNSFNKYNGKVKFLWLTKRTMDDALNFGLVNNSYIYNAVRFKSEEMANVLENKKLITIARLSHQKSIDVMIDIVKEVFEDKKYMDWKLEIYGIGPVEAELREQINDHKQIRLMGFSDNSKREFLSASLNLCTSKYEGFSLSILEANECGVPTIAFNFGESTEEEIINGKTGIIAKDKNDFIKQLKMFMDDEDKLKKLSMSAKEFSNNFQIDKIINEWINLFNELDGE